MEKAKFSGYRVVAGCAIFFFLTNGMVNVHYLFFPQYQEILQCSLPQLSAVISLLQAMMFLVSYLHPKALERLKPRELLWVTIGVLTVLICFLAYATNIWMYYAGGILVGVVSGLGGAVTLTHIISNWFIEKRATMTGAVMGCTFLGVSAYNYVVGQLTINLTYRQVFILLGAFTVIGSALCNMFLIRDTPESVGQKPLGWENREALAKAEEKSEVIYPSKEKRKAIYTSLVFILFVVAIPISSTLDTGFFSYCSLFWQNFGVSLSTASRYSALTMLFGGILSMAAGILVDKLGIRSYIVMLFVFYSLGLLSAIIWSHTLNTVFVVLQLLLCACAFSINYISAICCPSLFGREDAAFVQSRCVMAEAIGGVFLPILFSTVIEKAGYDMYFGLLILVNVLSAGLFLASLRVAAKRNTNFSSKGIVL